MADGTTDVSNLEQGNVCVMYISPRSNTPVIMLAGIVDLEHADGVIDGIFKALAWVGLSRDILMSTESGPNLVCLNFDWASVMQGNKNGIAGKLVRNYPHHDYFEPLFWSKERKHSFKIPGFESIIFQIMIT